VAILVSVIPAYLASRITADGCTLAGDRG
jgi:hypothetical protein